MTGRFLYLQREGVGCFKVGLQILRASEGGVVLTSDL